MPSSATVASVTLLPTSMNATTPEGVAPPSGTATTVAVNMTAVPLGAGDADEDNVNLVARDTIVWVTVQVNVTLALPPCPSLTVAVAV